MSEEIWRDIPGYEGKYQVSNFGNVKSTCKKKEKILKPYVITNGYLQVDLSTNNKRKVRLVHTLVLEAFVGPRPDNMDVCHNDGNKHNNHLDNLRYDTPSNNTIDNVKQNKNNLQKLSVDDVRQIRKLLSDNNLTMASIARMYNVSRETIRCIKTHKLWWWLDEN